jgi:predicted GNAT family N-acyltransferase
MSFLIANLTIKPLTWKMTLSLRQRVLWPNKPIGFSQVPQDETALHFGAYHDNLLIAVASIYPDHTQARLRKFAVDKSYQGKGVGTALLTFILSELAQQKVEYFWCDARENATQFYEKFGLSKASPMFYKENVAYYKMGLKLTQ